MKINKAIIPVAGWGTRRLPITKTIEKAMLPIGNRPLVDYVVEDCYKADIKDIYIVTDDKPESQVKDFYKSNPILEKYLTERGKEKRLTLANTARDGLNIHFFVQKEVNERYGNAGPVAQVVEEYGINEPVAVLMGDDFSYNADGSSDLKRMIDELEDPTECAMLATEIPHEEVEKYGVLNIQDGLLKGIYEKPSIEDAPSNFINISKYIMSPELLQLIVKYYNTHDFGPKDQEYLITDPIIEFIKADGKMRVFPIKGQYLDGGSLEGWLQANDIICGKNQ